MKAKQVYQTTDGQTFRFESDAEKAQERINFHTALQEFLFGDSFCFNSREVEHVMDLIVDNIEEIIRLYDKLN